MVAEKPFSTQQIPDEELITKINDCISRGITLKDQIARECNLTMGQLAYRLSRLQVDFSELDNQRTQRAIKNQQKNLKIIKGLMEYGFSEKEICQMIGCSVYYLRRLVATENNGMDIKVASLKERVNMPNHTLIFDIFKTATTGKTTIDEITQEVNNPKRPVNRTTVEMILVWLSKRNMWFSGSQLDEFRTKIQDRENKNKAMLKSYYKAAKKEKESELDLLIGSADDSEVKAYKKSIKNVTIKRREEYLDYVCSNKYTITEVFRNIMPQKKEMFFNEIADMMDINNRLVNKERVEKLSTIASEICGQKYALEFLRSINSSLIEQDKTEMSEQLESVKRNLFRQIILKKGGELRKKGFSDEQISEFMKTNFKFRVSKNDVLFVLGGVTDEQEKDRD